MTCRIFQLYIIGRFLNLKITCFFVRSCDCSSNWILHRCILDIRNRRSLWVWEHRKMVKIWTFRNQKYIQVYMFTLSTLISCSDMTKIDIYTILKNKTLERTVVPLPAILSVPQHFSSFTSARLMCNNFFMYIFFLMCVCLFHILNIRYLMLFNVSNLV